MMNFANMPLEKIIEAVGEAGPTYLGMPGEKEYRKFECLKKQSCPGTVKKSYCKIDDVEITIFHLFQDEDMKSIPMNDYPWEDASKVFMVYMRVRDFGFVIEEYTRHLKVL